MHRIKIVHVIGTLSRGGAERFVIDLCNEIAKNEKYEVYLLSLCINNTENTFLHEISDEVNYLSFGKKGGFSLSVFLKLTNWLKDKSPHIVHSHLNSFEYLNLYRLYKTRTAFFHTIHNIAEVECPNFLIKSTRGFFYKNNKTIPIVISQNGSKTYRDYYGLYNEIVIENARPALILSDAYNELYSQFKFRKDYFLLVHVGRISAEKNQQLLISGVQKFNETEKKKCKLLLIGDVQDEALDTELRRLASNDTHIEFLGGTNNIADYLHLADAFCLSSKFEGMPIALIEAMSVGCIPVCTPVGGIKEMIKDGVTGFLTKDLSPESYCETLKKALHNKANDAIKENIKKAYNRKYNIQIASNNHLKTYNKALNLFEGRDSAFELLYKSKV